ncbi:MAG: hypothetical protein IJW86_03740 [Clostridia bacterium]|nr:hypothetical protein [Clostridia bacterium]
MKKTLSLILCLVMLVTALPVVAFGEGEASVAVTPIEAFSEDNIPLSLQEIETVLFRYDAFNLNNSMMDFDVKVRLSDGSEHSLDKKNPFNISYYDYESYEDYIAAVEEIQLKLKEEYGGKPVAFGSAYVKKADYFEAKNENLDMIRVYVDVKVYEYNSTTGKYAAGISRELYFEKECVPYYYKLTPVSGLPDYFDRTTGQIDFSNTVFEIDCYDGTKKQAKVEEISTDIPSADYEFDGKKLEYRMYSGSKTVSITYYDCRYMWDVAVVKEFPPSKIQIEECVFEGDELKEVAYTVTGSYNQQYSFRKETSGDGEVIDTFEGNEVCITQTELSRFCSEVMVDIGGSQAQAIYAHEFDSFFMNFLAKIALFFQKIKNR